VKKRKGAGKAVVEAGGGRRGTATKCIAQRKERKSLRKKWFGKRGIRIYEGVRSSVEKPIWSRDNDGVEFP